MANDVEKAEDQPDSKALSISQRRQAIFDRTVSKFAAAGFQIDADPTFVAHINRWIAGEVDMHEAASRYEELLKNKRSRADRSDSSADQASVASDNLSSEGPGGTEGDADRN